MKKRFFVALTALSLAAILVLPGCSGENASGDKSRYTVVSVVVNRSYDFKEDFCDSFLYDDDFRTEGIFRLSDPDPAITLTLQDTDTGETFVFEKNENTEWYLKSTIDHLLYEDGEVDATLEIVTLGGPYGVENITAPATITVQSSLYSADFQKYPAYDYPYTVMNEDTNFTVDYDPSASDKTAKLSILKIPHMFELWLYNVETRDTDTFTLNENKFTFADEITVSDYDPNAASFWIHIPAQLEMEDGFVLEFTLSVNAYKKK
ncbi:MAG: hypothetical protein J6X72_05865 [Clostridia bacterium]|nr:hypothetical protein [Clostridia bacterium]